MNSLHYSDTIGKRFDSPIHRIVKKGYNYIFLYTHYCIYSMYKCIVCRIEIRTVLITKMKIVNKLQPDKQLWNFYPLTERLLS